MNADRDNMASVMRCADSHDPFWPRIELAALRRQLGLGVEVSEARLQVAARSAAITAAQEFAHWRLALRERGFKRLDTLAGHAPGRALSRCYRRCLEAATRRALFADSGLVCTSTESRRE